MSGTTAFHSSRTGRLGQLLSDVIRRARSVRVIVGFVTEAGLQEVVANNISALRGKLEYIVAGRFNDSCRNAFNALRSDPQLRGKLYVNLGLGRLKSGRMLSEWQPMVHAKVILAHMASGERWCYVGSANLTDYALRSVNEEAGIIHTDDGEGALIDEVARYTDHIRNLPSTRPYDPSLDRLLLTLNRLAGYAVEVQSQFDSLEEPFLLLMVDSQLFTVKSGALPDRDLLVYFDLPRGLGALAGSFGRANKRIVLLFFDSVKELLKRGAMPFRVGEVTLFNDADTGEWEVTQNVDVILEFTDAILPPKLLPRARPPAKPDRNKFFQVNLRLYSRQHAQENAPEIVALLDQGRLYDIVMAARFMPTVEVLRYEPVEEGERDVYQIIEASFSDPPMTVGDAMSKLSATGAEELFEAEIAPAVEDSRASLERLGERPEKAAFDHAYKPLDDSLKRVLDFASIGRFWLLRANKVLRTEARLE